MATTRERREARAERLRGWAEKRQATATATINTISDRFHGDWALVTQPGHIPERARMIAREDRAIESLNKADAMNGRAAGIESQLDRSIYSDDVDAVERLEERIAELTAKRDGFKAQNDAFRKEHRAELKALSVYGRDQAVPHPSWEVTNLSANIRRLQDRLVVVSRPPEAEHGRYLEVRYQGVCRVCGCTLERGATALYFKQAKEIACYPPCQS